MEAVHPETTHVHMASDMGISAHSLEYGYGSLYRVSDYKAV